MADVLRLAGVSRETFYQQFDSKQDCFLACFEDLRNRAVAALLPLPSEGSPLQRYSEVLARYLGTLAADVATARLFLVEVYAAGPAVARRRLELQEDFVAGIAALFSASTEQDRFACQALVAAISTLTTNALLDADSSGTAVRSLHQPLVDLAARLFDE